MKDLLYFVKLPVHLSACLSNQYDGRNFAVNEKRLWNWINKSYDFSTVSRNPGKAAKYRAEYLKGVCSE